MEKEFEIAPPISKFKLFCVEMSISCPSKLSLHFKENENKPFHFTLD